MNQKSIFFREKLFDLHTHALIVLQIKKNFIFAALYSRNLKSTVNFCFSSSFTGECTHLFFMQSQVFWLTVLIRIQTFLVN